MPFKTKNDRKAYYERWYANPKNAAKKKLTAAKWRKIARKRNREWFRTYKSKLKCSNCPENHPACLDFHHRDEATKHADVSRLAFDGGSLETLEAEILKCDVLCRNCHAKLHDLKRIKR